MRFSLLSLFISIILLHAIPCSVHGQFEELSTKNEESRLRNLNSFLSKSTFWLPNVDLRKELTEDNEIVDSLLPKISYFNFQNIRITELRMDSIKHDYKQKDNTEYNYVLLVEGIRCEARAVFKYRPVFAGTGLIKGSLRNSAVKIKLRMRSPNFNERAMQKLIVTDCESEFMLGYLSITGNFRSEVLSAIANFLQKQVEMTLGTAMCTSLQEELIGSPGFETNLTWALGNFSEYIEPYYEKSNVNSNNFESIFPSASITPNAIVQFSDPESDLGLVASQIEEQINSYYGVVVPDEYGVLDSDLGINIFLRNAFLEDGVLSIETLEPIELGDENNNITMKIQDIKINGLDTFRTFKPFTIQGSVIESKIAIKNLRVEVELDMNFRTINEVTQATDEFQYNFPTSTQELKFSFGVDEFETSLGANVIINKNNLSKIRIGSLVFVENILPCVFYPLLDFDMNTLEVNARKYDIPEIERLFDEAIVKFLNVGITLADSLANPLIYDALPNIVATEVRQKINEFVFCQHQSSLGLKCEYSDFEAQQNYKTCPTMFSSTYIRGNPIQFQNLLNAQSSNGNCISPYGDIGCLLKNFLRDNIVGPDETDSTSPLLNNFIRMNLADERGSGTITIQNLEDTVQPLEFDVYTGKYKLEVLGVTFENVDTFQYPLEIIEPSFEHETVLLNKLKVGTQQNPLTALVDLRFGFTNSDDGTLETEEFRLVFETFNAEIHNSLLLTIDELSLMELSPFDLMRTQCVLSVIIPAIAPTYELLRETGLNILNLKLEIGGFKTKFECIKCSRLGFLQQVMTSLNSEDFLRLLMNIYAQALGDLLSGPYVSEQIHEMLLESRKECPSHPDYDESFSTAQEEQQEPSLLQRGSKSGFTLFGSNDQDSSSTSSPLVFDEIDRLMSELTENQNKALFLTGASAYMLGPLFFSLPAMKEFSSSYEFNSPLLLKKEFISGPATLLDFTNLEDTLLGWAVEPLELFASTLKEKRNDPKIGRQDLGINIQLRETFQAGALTIFPDIVLGDLSLESIQISGLDSFEYIEPYYILGPQTVQSGFKLKRISVRCKMSTKNRSLPTSVQYRRKERRNSEESTEKEKFDITFGFTDLEFKIALYLALDYSKLASVKLGTLFDVSRIVSCLNQTAVHAELTQTHFNIGRVNPIEINGFFDSQTQIMVKRTHQKILKLFSQDISDSLPIMADKYLRPLLNNIIFDFISKQNECKYISESFQESSPYVDFRDLLLSPKEAIAMGATGTMPYGNIWYLGLKSIKDNAIMPDEKGSPKINSGLIASLTKGQSGTEGDLNFPDPLVDYFVEYGNIFHTEGNLTFTGPFNSYVQNLDSFTYPLRVLNPTGQHEHENIAMMGGVEEGPLEAGFTFNMSISYEKYEENFPVELSIKFRADKIGVNSRLLTKVLEKNFMSYPLEDATNFWCWVNTIPPPELNEFGERVDKDWLGTGRTLGLLDFEIVSENILMEIVCPLCEERQKSFTIDISESGILDFLSILMFESGVFQNELDKALWRAQFMCPHNPNFRPTEEIPEFTDFPDPDTGFDNTLPFLGLSVSIFVFILLVFSIKFTTSRLVKKRQKYWLRSLPEDEVLKLYIDYMKEKYHDKLLSEVTTSMFKSKDQIIPPLIRYITPTLVILNIGLFMSGHLNLGASIDVFIKIGVQFNLYNVYTFSVIGLVSDLWMGKGKELAAIIFITSLIWPYAKQIITLLMWILPPSVVAPRRRGRILETLDTLAKWSMIDIFILIIASIAFRMIVSSAPNWPDEYYSIDMMMSPKWGMFANFFAQIVSQISSHWIIHYHRKVVRAGEEKIKEGGKNGILASSSLSTNRVEKSNGICHDAEEEESWSGKSKKDKEEDRTALCDHNFVLTSDKTGQVAYISQKTSSGITLFGILTILFLVAGCGIPYVRIDRTGIMGYLIREGGGDDVKWFSVFTTAGLLMEMAKFLNKPLYYLGLGMFASTLVISCVIVPVTQVGYTIYLWRVPLTIKEKHRASLIIEILKAWQYTEVYFLSTLVMMWQTGTISENIAKRLFGSINPILTNFVAKGLIEEREARVWYTNATIEAGVAVHLLSTMMLWMFTHLVESAYKQYLKEYETSIVDKQINDEENLEIMAKIDQMEKISDFEYIIKELEKVPLKFTDYYSYLCSMKYVGDSSSSSPSVYSCDSSIAKSSIAKSSIAKSIISSASTQNNSVVSSASAEVSLLLLEKQHQILSTRGIKRKMVDDTPDVYFSNSY